MMKRTLINSYSLCVPIKTTVHISACWYLVLPPLSWQKRNKRSAKDSQWKQKLTKESLEMWTMKYIDDKFVVLFTSPCNAKQNFSEAEKMTKPQQWKKKKYFKRYQIAFRTPCHKVPYRSCISNRLAQSYRWKYFQLYQKSQPLARNLHLLQKVLWKKFVFEGIPWIIKHPANVRDQHYTGQIPSLNKTPLFVNNQSMGLGCNDLTSIKDWTFLPVFKPNLSIWFLMRFKLVLSSECVIL